MAETQTTTATTTTAPDTATETTAQEQNTAAQTENGNEAGQQPETYSAAEVEKMISRAVDRATNKLGNDNKKLRGDLEAERKKNMSEKELKALELKEKEDEIAERERALTEKENRMIALKALRKSGLDDGSDDSLELVDFVMADTEEEITERVSKLNGLIERLVKAKVDGVFKANGRTPGVGSDTAANAGGQNSLAVQLGRSTAKNNEAAQSVLNHYLGGKK